MKGGSRGREALPALQSITVNTKEAVQQMKPSQKNMAPARLVLHQLGSPFLKPSSRSPAWGSFEASLQPGWVQAEIVVMKLECGVQNADETESKETYAINRFMTVPPPFNMKPTRTSLNARERRASLSYFSYTTGTSNMSAERTMLVTDTKMANPDKPAANSGGEGRKQNGVEVWRTWANFPLGLETGYACETGHGNKVEEYLGDSEHDHRFGDNHLRERVIRRGAMVGGRRVRCRHVSGRELTSSSKETIPWFPLPMPENEVSLLDGLKRSTRPVTVSEKPMFYVSSEVISRISWRI